MLSIRLSLPPCAVLHRIPVASFFLVAFVLIAGGSFAPATVDAEDAAGGDTGSQVQQSWSQWRGPNRDGQLTGQQWPSRLDGALAKQWSVELSPSYSGPIVHEGNVITTETVDKKYERVTAYDLKTGKLTWQTQWEGAMAVPFFAASNGSWIRSTPACSKEHLLVLGMRDLLVCLDPRDGNERWRINFPKEHGSPVPAFGGVCSPLIDGDQAYVQTGRDTVCVSLSDGAIRWKTLGESTGMMSGGAFSSPT
ncbi:MAG: PQQ-binding-like beta-propeller repeat protein, partial [Planctomycetota bacterium]